MNKKLTKNTAGKRKVGSRVKKERILSRPVSVSEENIRNRAYRIWKKKGMPENSALEDWR